MNIIISIILFFALFTKSYFFCNYFIWLAFKLKPDNFKKDITRKDINRYNVVGFISCFLWALFVFLILTKFS